MKERRKRVRGPGSEDPYSSTLDLSKRAVILIAEAGVLTDGKLTLELLAIAAKNGKVDLSKRREYHRKESIKPSPITMTPRFSHLLTHFRWRNGPDGTDDMIIRALLCPGNI